MRVKISTLLYDFFIEANKLKKEITDISSLDYALEKYTEIFFKLINQLRKGANMSIEIKVDCVECNRTIQLDDVVYCYECVEALKKENLDLGKKVTELSIDLAGAVKEKDEFVQQSKGLLEALKSIADNPCLDPEGNADIAQQAIVKVEKEWKRKW